MSTNRITKQGIAVLATMGTLTIATALGSTAAHAQPPCQIDFSHPLLGDCPFGPPGPPPAPLPPSHFYVHCGVPDVSNGLNDGQFGQCGPPH